MGLRTYVLLMAIGTFLAWMAWIVIVMNVNPMEAGFLGFFMFYLTLAVSLVGSLALIGTFFRIIILKRHEVPSREIRIAFRHAVLFAGVAIVSLLLAANGLLRTWHVVALIAVASIVEYLFLQAQQGRG
ncbi:hypothetical protein A3E39_03510 [Candidatus Uhrbacteria bacterium RIFCSPHIGHO2_12_FULL_60_25]|uniref:Uncharacterized protein n=1 Tax=Candidatus Uhrbacteria bacterium RIFCSPHIGHO2_12_FULL_60_25 TaxID=1802399 RepID=A0A1F7UKQ5_9BACT|nr:MAG: hypothetical protein A3D73_03525 [Candidatus Uhrbacteria bacterium RIFCSPHIGHO2_02_FULL_60_44]OGL78870.1 MAG: hypothetical protein A3E39_03510 [Candidatus Uhrbacteria bacterium RIFCSPHIGHO2_12_FULL_60_25]